MESNPLPEKTPTSPVNQTAFFFGVKSLMEVLSVIIIKLRSVVHSSLTLSLPLPPPFRVLCCSSINLEETGGVIAAITLRP